MRSILRWLLAGMAGLVMAGCSPVPTVVGRIEIPLYVGGIAVGGDAVWLRQVGSGRSGPIPGGPGAVLRLDPKLKQIVARIPLPVSNFGGDIAVGEGAVWVTEGLYGENLIRIDATTNEVVATIPIGKDPQAVAVGAGAVWVHGFTTIYRIDPRTNQVAYWIPIWANAALAVGSNAVWLTNPIGGKVARIDPRTNAIVATIPVAAEPRNVLAGEGVVWILHTPFTTHPQPSHVSRVDPATNKVLGEPIPVGNWAHIALGEGYLLIGSHEGRDGGKITRIDPQTLRQVGEPIQIKPFISRLAFGLDSVFAISVSADPAVRPTVIYQIRQTTISERILGFIGLSSR